MSEPASPQVAAAINAIGETAKREHPLFRSLDAKTREVRRGGLTVEVTLPQTLADADGLAHGGAFTLILDTILAFCTWTRLEAPLPLATINLKTDFYESRKPGTRIVCAAECDRVVGDIGYCHGRAYDAEDGALLAHGAGTFMLSGTPPQEGSRL